MFNLGVGFYYDAPNFFFSFFIPRMFSAERHKERNEQTIQVRDQPHHYGQRAFDLNCDFLPYRLLVDGRRCPQPICVRRLVHLR